MNKAYIIIGAGSAGCVLVNRLSEDGNNPILLLEAGVPDKKQEIHIPAAFSKLFQSEVDWNYTTEPQAQVNGREMFWPRGKMLGGSSSINAMIHQRGHPSDYDGWAALGNEEWGWEEMLPYFKKSENQERGESEFHNTGGPLNISELREVNPLSLAFIEAAVQAGYSRNDDFNDGEQEGFGLYQVTQKKGSRFSCAIAYLRPALQRDTLQVETEAQVTRLLIEDRRCVGVEYIQKGQTHQVRADREVILCGGAINSPQLLMLSGIGPAAHLQDMGIEAVIDLPGVGQNLQDHLAIAATWYCNEKISLASAESIGNLVKYLFMKRGMLTSNVGEAGGFIKLNPESPAPELQYHFAPVFFVRHGFDSPEEHGFTIAPTQVKVASKGYIRLKSADPLAHPEIQPHYLMEEADMQILVDGIKIAREIAHQSAFDAYRGEEHMPGNAVQSDDELREFVRQHTQSLYHPVGTCKMGVDSMAVVNPALQVHGIQGLRVVDASIMPNIVNANTNTPTIAIAEKAAEMICG